MDTLRDNWRGWLARSLGHIAKHQVDEADAPQVLQELSPSAFDELDQALRYGCWDPDLGWPARGLVPLTPISGGRADTEAYLFVAACDANGFLREQALQALEAFPGRVAMAAALLRCDDWVEPVRARARQLLDHVLQSNSGGEIWHLLDLLLVLRRRTRFSQSAWPEQIEPILYGPQFGDERWKATQQGRPKARLLALECVSSCEPERLAEACRLAVGSADPAVAHWGLAQSRRSIPSDAAEWIVQRALKHPLASVRAGAVRMHAAINPCASSEWLIGFLFDPALAPRNAAAYLLRTNHGIDPSPIWRAALDQGIERDATVSAIALGEHATAEDAERLAALLQSDKAILRASALCGLARAAPGQIADHVASALTDPSIKVSRLAISLCRKTPNLVSAELVHDVVDRASNLKSLSQLIRLVRLLDKWTALGLLLAWCIERNSGCQEAVCQELAYWIDHEGKQFTPLRSTVKLAISESLQAAKCTSLPIPWERIEYAIAYG